MQVEIIANTDGKGSHTEEAREVRITKLAVGYSNHTYYPELPFEGEIKAYFEPCGFMTGSWNVEAYGTICTDKKWLQEFKRGLRKEGFSIRASRDVSYNEHRAQGSDYVSLAVGPAFYASWKRLNAKKGLE